MAYTPNEWGVGNLITASKMNKIERQLVENTSDLDDIRNGVTVPTYEEFETLRNDVATEYDAIKTYAVGDYVIYNTQLYKCKTAITSVETWTAAHWDAVEVGEELQRIEGKNEEEVAELKSAIKAITDNEFLANWGNGLYRLNVETVTLTPESNNNYKCQIIQCVSGNVFTISGGSYGNAARLWAFVKSDGTRLDVEANSVTVSKKVITAPTGTAYLLINWYTVGGNIVTVETGVNLVDRVDTIEEGLSNTDATAKSAFDNSNASSIATTIQHASDENYTTNLLYAFKAKKTFVLASYKFSDATSGTVTITILRYNRSNGKYVAGNVYTGNVGDSIAIGETLYAYDAILYKVSGSLFYGSTIANNYFSYNYGWNAFLNITVDSSLGYNLAGEFTVIESNADSAINQCRYIGRECSVFDNILCIGDSITQGAPTPPDITPDPSKATRTVVNQTMYSYPASIGKQYGVTCTNWGRSGITSQGWYDYYSVNEPSWSGHDAAVILLGNNDYHLVDDLGGLTDETLPIASARSKAAMMSIITKLKADNADIKIFICTLLPGWARATTLSPLVCDNIRDIAYTEENVFLIDLASYSLLVGESAYMNNHPTAIGYNRLAQEIGGAIGYTVINNLEKFKWVQFIGTEYAMDGQ